MSILSRGADRAGAIRLANDALENEVCSREPQCVYRAMTTLLCAEELITADEHWLRMTTTCPADLEHVLMLVRARMDLLNGNLVDADRLLHTLMRGDTPHAIRPFAATRLIELLSENGEVKRAEATLAEFDVNGMISSANSARPLLIATRGTVHLASGRFLPAVRDFVACGLAFSSENMANPAFSFYRIKAALAAKGAQRPEMARELANQEWTTAQHWGAPRNIAWAMYAVGVVEDDKRTVELLSEAADLLELAGAPIELGLVCAELGTRLAAAGEVRLARDRLRLAATLGSRLGNTDRVTQMELALRQIDLSVAESTLTRQETRIAKLARAGYSNQQIAAKLFLAVRTIEFHLGHTYRKLGISGRQELRSTRVKLT